MLPYSYNLHVSHFLIYWLQS